MASYIYKARDEQGKSFIGHIKATTKSEARGKLRKAGYYPISITPEARFRLSDLLQRLRPIGLDDLIIFAQQFSSMIHSGLPILHCLDIIWKQTENKRFQVIISKIREDLSEGSTLFDAMKKYPDVFSMLFVNLINVGELSGTLDESLQKIVEYFSKEYELRQRVKSAFVYPTIVLTVAIAVVVFMVTAIVPVFSKVFARMAVRSALPLPTIILIKLSEFTKCLWWALPLFLLAACLAYNAVNKTRRGKYLIDSIKLKLPVLGKLIHKLAVSRFTRALGIITGRGIPINKALRITSGMVDNVIIRRAIVYAEKRVMSGTSFHQPLDESGLFPDIVIQMIATGEEAGTMDMMLITAADQIDQEIDYKVKKLTIALEPALTIILGIIVGFIAISLYLPMFDMVKLMRR